MNYWWVFEGKWFEKEHIGGYIHAPQYGKNGSNAPFHWKNVSEVRKGDYILSYLKMYIVAIGIAVENPVVIQQSPNLGEKQPGWQVKVSWTNLDRHFLTMNVWEETKHLFQGEMYMPLNCNGTGNQGFLYQINKKIFDTYFYYIKKSVIQI